MKKQFFVRALCVLLASLTLATVTACSDSGKGTSETSGQTSADGQTDRYLILTNKQNPLGENYIPPSLTDISPVYTMRADYKDYKLQKEAATAVESMLRAMHGAGYSSVLVTSAYRNYGYQKNLFNRYVSDEKAKDPYISDAEAVERVLKYSARPGTSEHQTGLCVDLFDSYRMKELENYGHEGTKDDVGFAETPAFEWLKTHAHEYGFILRYPEDKVEITGYQYESWHYRYVGVDAATEIHRQGITLEEYLAD
jgi:D-alanyl-D-alanine carboxypeptidase